MAQPMTYTELVIWADRNDKVLVPKDEYDKLSVDVAASIATQTADLNRDYRALFGTWRGDA
jgi:hypothetical protein